uniref:Uncharacterized protein n=1 Tax=Meloidogyne incognita TaxID=6306 RepID=A0A914LMW1_MELIC
MSPTTTKPYLPRLRATLTRRSSFQNALLPSRVVRPALVVTTTAKSDSCPWHASAVFTITSSSSRFATAIPSSFACPA